MTTNGTDKLLDDLNRLQQSMAELLKSAVHTDFLVRDVGQQLADLRRRVEHCELGRQR